MGTMWLFVAALGCGGLLIGSSLWAEGSLTHAMAIHAALMVTAWGALIPLGGIVARYFKVTRNQNFPAEVDNPFWWDWHRRLQYGGIGLATVALAVILSETGGQFDTLHGRLGLLVMIIGWLQVFSALVRGSKGGATDHRADPHDSATWRGDHYDMTRRRLFFEAWHKRAGWAVIVLAHIAIMLGIALVGAPIWLLCIAGLLQAAALVGLLEGCLRGRWVDTYAALWGPDPVHPGNRRVSESRARPRRWRSPQ